MGYVCFEGGGDMPTINENLKQLRQISGMTQASVADAIAVTRQTVSSYESGRTQPDLETLKRLAEVYGADLHDVLYGGNRFQRKLRRVQHIVIILTVIMLLGILTHSFLRLYVYNLVRDASNSAFTPENIPTIKMQNARRRISEVATEICTGIYGIGFLIILHSLIQLIHAITYRKIFVFSFVTIIAMFACTLPFAIADDVPGFAEYTIPLWNSILIVLLFFVILVIAKFIKRRH